jgi:hypothetical protein
MNKRHFTVVIGSKEHGLYVSSTPSSAAKKAPPYSYNYSTYHKPDGIPPYQIISREFTNQIYGWLGKYGTLENFRPKFDTLTDENELPLRFSYKLKES